jgi:hypothetical protein
MELESVFEEFWRAPKSLVRLKLGLSYSHSEIVKDLEHASSS